MYSKLSVIVVIGLLGVRVQTEQEDERDLIYRTLCLGVRISIHRDQKFPTFWNKLKEKLIKAADKNDSKSSFPRRANEEIRIEDKAKKRNLEYCLGLNGDVPIPRHLYEKYMELKKQAEEMSQNKIKQQKPNQKQEKERIPQAPQLKPEVKVEAPQLEPEVKFETPQLEPEVKIERPREKKHKKRRPRLNIPVNVQMNLHRQDVNAVTNYINNVWQRSRRAAYKHWVEVGNGVYKTELASQPDDLLQKSLLKLLALKEARDKREQP